MKAILTLVAAATVLSLTSCSSTKKEEACSSCSAPVVSSKSPSKVTKHKH